MSDVPILIVGAGPIGLAGALLFAKFGVRALVVERRGDVNTHPRSRFVDTNTMELMRVLGVEKAVEDTGLGPDWTAFNRWFDALTRTEFAAISSPTFHTVPRETSPTLPVMTCQDYVENVLLSKVAESELIELRYLTEAVSFDEQADGVNAVLRDLGSNQEYRVQARYLLGTDGPHSLVRQLIGSELQSDPRNHYSQDVIFEADLSQQVGDRKGGLLYCAMASGVLVFQPLDGDTRWRCQIFKPDPELLSDEETIARIHEAVGVDTVSISITSTGIWQPTPGCTDNFGRGRVYLAGDAAHVSLPTGGMGNNIGFAGIRNLSWKIAYALKGHSPAEIIATYETEHRPYTLQRIEVGVGTTGFMGQLFQAIYAGTDLEPAKALTQQYADHDGALLGFELASTLIAEEHGPPPPVDDRVRNFVPCIRSGRRAPHIWIDVDQQHSVLDWFGTEYVLVTGSAVRADRWRAAAATVAGTFPLQVHALPDGHADIYQSDELVLVRPDGIIADHWRDNSVDAAETASRLSAMLPLARD